MRGEINRLRAQIISIISILGGLLLLGGIVVAVLGRMAEITFKFFGQQFSSTSVGVALVFIGAVMIVMTLHRILKSLDQSESNQSRAHSRNAPLKKVNNSKDETNIVVNSIGTINIGSSISSITQVSKGKEVVFVSEGTVRTRTGFKIAFSVWNNKDTPIKLFSVNMLQHVNVHSMAYYGGPRSLCGYYFIKNRKTH